MHRAAQFPPWQTSWAVKCHNRCCQSAHCANIKCAACYRSIVYPTHVREAPPLARYTCPACLEEDAPIDLHEECWQLACADHWHTDWLKVLPDGTHVQVAATAIDPSPSSSDDVPSGTILNRTVSGSLAGKSCPICSCCFNLGEVITQLRCLHGYHNSCLVDLDRSFECLACKQQVQEEDQHQGQKQNAEHGHSTIFLRAADGRCLSVFPQPGPFTVLQLKQEISKEDGIDSSDCRIFGAGRLLCDDEEVLLLPEEILRSLTLAE